MIPDFPVFRKIMLSDRAIIEPLPQALKHYSDHQFSSLWAWNLDDDIQISVLNDNIVFITRDYLTSKRYLSFSGFNNLHAATSELLRYSSHAGLQPILKFVPEEMATVIAVDNTFKVSEDRDNFDYVISVDQILKADEKKSRRKYLRQFQNRFSPTVTILDLKNRQNRDLLANCAREWTIRKDNNPEQLNNEIPAMVRLITDLPETLTALCVFDDQKLIGFSIEEVIDSIYATGHFQRIDYEYRRAFTFLNHEVCTQLQKIGIKYINIQQDAGDLQLREKKLEKYDVAYFLKKYTIELRT